jgi:hypothetical protein
MAYTVQAFLDSLKVNGKEPDRYSEDNVRPALIAHFYLGRCSDDVKYGTCNILVHFDQIRI